MMDLVRQLTVAVLMSERSENGVKMIVVLCGGSERPVDVSCKADRVSQRSPAVMFGSVPRVAEHLIYTRAMAAAPA